MDIRKLLETVDAREASDLHLKTGSVPILRIHGVLVPLDGSPPFDPEDTSRILDEICGEALLRHFSEAKELDFSYSIDGGSRYRVNASVQRGSVSLAFRRIAIDIPRIDELELPNICYELALKRQGLIIVTGPTGCGKSTTLAAMIEHMNQQVARRIISIEDPIEFVYQDARSVITQRELGRDTHSFADALKYALRQDVGVLLVGEMRDQDTVAACLTAAETGHLVLSTLHTNSASMTIDRIVDAFPPYQQGQIRMQLSLTLEAVLAQTLVPRRDGMGRVVAVEVMLANSAVRNLIREGKTHQINSVIQTSVRAGMQTMEHALRDLALRDMITLDQALDHANEPEALRRLLEAEQ